MKKEFKVLPPAMPDFVRFEQPAGKKQDSFKPVEGYDIANFTEEEAKEFARLMMTTFMDHWKARREKLGIILPDPSIVVHSPGDAKCPDCWGSGWAIQFSDPCKTCKGKGIL